MRIFSCVRAAVVSAALVLLSGAPAHAQLYEAVGTRAQGMGGAFVAVADDATTTWWNPAGIGTGAFFSAVIDHGQTTDPGDPLPGQPAVRNHMNAFAAVFPALGVSYYRVRISEVRPTTSTALVPADRQDSGAVASGVRSRALNEFGVTVAQSLGRHFIVGTTLKLLRGGGAFVEGVPADAPLDVADGLSIEARTKSDLDVGMMASFAHVRLGMAVRNVFEPDMGTKAAPLILERQARAGMAVITSKFGPVDALTISADADLTRTFTVFGDARHVAVGGELWVLTRHLGVRGGASANTVGDKRTALSAGVSVAAYRGIYVDVFRAFGLNRSLKGWGTALRVTF